MADGDIKISPANLPNGTLGVAYSETLQADGCSGKCVWSSTGTLPTGLSLGSTSGTISGTPTVAGAFHFTVTAKDQKSNTGSQAYTVNIANTPALTITTAPTLPSGTTGASYSQSFSASGGAPPYTWAVTSGSLPPGLSLNASSGVATGTPTSAATFNFTVQVKDAKGATASQGFTLTIIPTTPKLTITSTTLPGGAVGAGYSVTLTASGGTPPYSWALTSGALPDGLSLNSSSGTISGTPGKSGTFAFTARVTDQSSAVADQSFQLTVASAPPPPTPPTLSFSGVPNSTGSGVQMPFDLVLSSAAGQEVTGQVVLTFQPNAAVARDDPAIRFSTGSRTASFTIPAGASKAVFQSGSLAFQTGTVAGTLTLAASSSLPDGNTRQNVVVAPASPVIQGATVVQNSSGFQIQVTGFSNTRELAGASFHFTAVPGQTVQTGDLSVSLANLASQWYTGSTSTQFGGQFLLVVPFAVSQGAASGLSSVAVQLQNGQSTSAAVTAKF